MPGDGATAKKKNWIAAAKRQSGHGGKMWAVEWSDGEQQRARSDWDGSQRWRTIYEPQHEKPRAEKLVVLGNAATRGKSVGARDCYLIRIRIAGHLYEGDRVQPAQLSQSKNKRLTRRHSRKRQLCSSEGRRRMASAPSRHPPPPCAASRQQRKWLHRQKARYARNASSASGDERGSSWQSDVGETEESFGIAEAPWDRGWAPSHKRITPTTSSHIEAIATAAAHALRQPCGNVTAAADGDRSQRRRTALDPL